MQAHAAACLWRAAEGSVLSLGMGVCAEGARVRRYKASAADKAGHATGRHRPPRVLRPEPMDPTLVMGGRLRFSCCPTGDVSPLPPPRPPPPLGPPKLPPRLPGTLLLAALSLLSALLEPEPVPPGGDLTRGLTSSVRRLRSRKQAQSERAPHGGTPPAAVLRPDRKTHRSVMLPEAGSVAPPAAPPPPVKFKVLREGSSLLLFLRAFAMASRAVALLPAAAPAWPPASRLRGGGARGRAGGSAQHSTACRGEGRRW